MAQTLDRGTFGRRHEGRHRVRLTPQDVLLASGILYAGTYVIANDGIAASVYPGYSRMDQAVSELSAKGAPTRPFLVGMSAVWTPAMVAFGTGVWRSAGGRRALRATGALLTAFGVTSLAWLPFPMTARKDMTPGKTPGNDVGHLVMSGVSVLLIMAQTAFGAAALGKRFRLYSTVTAAVVLVSGGLLARVSPNVGKGEDTPWMGLYERACIGAWLAWMTVLAAALMRQHRTGSVASWPGGCS